MSPRARALIGVLTAVFFLVMAGSLFASERYTFAAVLGALGAFRGLVAARQLWWVFGPDDDDDDDDDDEV